MRHVRRLQGICVCGLGDIIRQWKGRRSRSFRMSKHWTSRDLMPPSQFLEHWENRQNLDIYLRLNTNLILILLVKCSLTLLHSPTFHVEQGRT